MKTIKIKEDVKIGNVILEAGDQIKILKENDASDSLEAMNSNRGNNVFPLMDEISEAFDTWKDATYSNFDDDDAVDWGYYDLDDAVNKAKEALLDSFKQRLDKVHNW